MQSRKEKEKSILWNVYFVGPEKKRLSDAVIQEVEGDPGEEGVLGNRGWSSVSYDAERLRLRKTTGKTIGIGEYRLGL